MVSIAVHHGRCTLCGLCDLACDTSALSLVMGRFEFIPEICCGKPWCVDACPEEALVLHRSSRRGARFQDQEWVTLAAEIPGEGHPNSRRL
ncbi:MAG TPA: hypothetical protein VI893_03455, partial [Thermoplasmata archaeon]|nr:hypothetical protein [Thermoplasmata archaeon]